MPSDMESWEERPAVLAHWHVHAEWASEAARRTSAEEAMAAVTREKSVAPFYMAASIDKALRNSGSSMSMRELEQRPTSTPVTRRWTS